MLLKFFVCYEGFFFTLSVLMLIYCADINVMILLFYLLSNSTFEVMLGLSSLMVSSIGYFIFLFVFSALFSNNTMVDCSSDNFECGFYSVVTSSMRYRFNYWMVIFHFIIFELELVVSLFLAFGLLSISFNSNAAISTLLGLLFAELLSWVGVIHVSSITFSCLLIFVLFLFALTFIYNVLLSVAWLAFCNSLFKFGFLSLAVL